MQMFLWGATREERHIVPRGGRMGASDPPQKKSIQNARQECGSLFEQDAWSTRRFGNKAPFWAA